MKGLRVTSGHGRNRVSQFTVFPVGRGRDRATHSHLFILKCKLVKSWPRSLMEDLGGELMLTHVSTE